MRKQPEKDFHRLPLHPHSNSQLGGIPHFTGWEPEAKRYKVTCSVLYSKWESGGFSKPGYHHHHHHYYYYECNTRLLNSQDRLKQVRRSIEAAGEDIGTWQAHQGECNLHRKRRGVHSKGGV